MARRYFKTANRIVNVASSTVVGNDFAYDETTEPRPPGTDLINWYMDRVIVAAQHNDVIALRFTGRRHGPQARGAYHPDVHLPRPPLLAATHKKVAAGVTSTTAARH